MRFDCGRRGHFFGSISQSNSRSPTSVQRSNLHSHRQCTDHPRRRSLLSFVLSRLRLRSNFGVQYSTLLFRSRPSRQEWPCQKQPFTSMMVRYFGSTMSGQPGRFRTCKRKRYPRLWSALRTSSSGFVLTERMRDIRAERAGVVTSFSAVMRNTYPSL